MLYTSGSQHRNHGGPPKMNINILATNHTIFKLFLVSFNPLTEKEFTNLFLMLLRLIGQTFKNTFHVVFGCKYYFNQNAKFGGPSNRALRPIS